jgi:hypothetical protein
MARLMIAHRELAPLPTLGFMLLETILWMGARDTFRKYNQRMVALHNGRSNER